MNIERVQGCANRSNILRILFDENEIEHIVPLKIKACKNKYDSNCSMEGCHRYRIGTRGTLKISWDCKGKRM